VIAGVLMWRTPKLGLAGLAGALVVLAVFGPAVHPWYLTWCLPPAAVVLAGRRAPWAMVIAVVVAASSRPMGGGLVKNLGYFSVPALIVLVVLAVVGWRWWGSRRPATQPSSSST
jgi:alpha-1,6-mannosyltransferase